ncbi:hypothetical protein HNR42_003393 [Deinobacterium chartae]|uniref:Uncharacterized protein n=1 Tax=Deinobacterium chartae TaxID=521158 RepID=A0A841I3P4_9DEIO|nr:hypothetical protein [Deinobacterium chartae]
MKRFMFFILLAVAAFFGYRALRERNFQFGELRLMRD